MPRPQNKIDLIEAATTEYNKLLVLIDSLTEEELNTPFDFSMDEKKTEAHWKRDKNLRDALMHLHEWHELTLNWIANNKSGIHKPYLMEGYNWKTYGNMNLVFWNNCQKVSLEEAKAKFIESHEKIMKLIEAMPEKEMFERAAYDWEGTSNFAAYFISNTSSHYSWAMKKIKAHRKKVKEKND